MRLIKNQFKLHNVYDVYSLYISENELKKTTIMDATTRVQEVIDKLEQYKKIE